MIGETPAPPAPVRSPASGYAWVALSNTSLGSFMASLDASIVIVSLPAILRGIGMDPLSPSNIGYLLWLVTGYLLTTAVLVVTVGRLGDIFGRVRIYNAGFVVFTLASIALSFDPFRLGPGAIWLILWRVVQAIGGSMLLANAAAILVDAFPADRRGMALGINQVSALSGQFVGLVLGGVLAAVDWRLVFWVNVPVGVFGTVWAYRSLRELADRRRARIDWLGNASFAAGTACLLAAATYGIQPYAGDAMGWTRPIVVGGLALGVTLIAVFVVVEKHVPEPMFDLALFRIRPFAAGGLANFLAAICRGGLQFMLIIWLQGIWLPLHGFDYAQTPLWAGIFLLPLTAGILVAGPISGVVSDRVGVRRLSTTGLWLFSASFVGLLLLPVDFGYPAFGTLIAINGIGSGMFAAPNTSSMMGSVQPWQRGAASGMRQTLQNCGTSLAIGLFFTLLVVGMANELPSTLTAGLQQHGVDAATSQHASNLSPVSSLFAAFLGENPVRQLVGSHTLADLPATQSTTLTSRTFFPHLIAGPFHDGLLVVFATASILAAMAAVASAAAGKTRDQS
jgi:EmrB/QacA subfamily drug resistance transporter